MNVANVRCEYSKRISLYFHSEEKAKREEERGNEEGDAKEWRGVHLI